MSQTKLVERMAHVGWVSDNRAAFETFWCDLLGYSIVHTSKIPTEMTEALFAIYGGAEVYRYSREGCPVEIELHVFEAGSIPASQSYHRFGINHVCLWVRDRVALLNSLPQFKNVPGLGTMQLARRIYENPGGWQNIFLRDFEGNWVELRQHM